MHLKALEDLSPNDILILTNYMVVLRQCVGSYILTHGNEVMNLYRIAMDIKAENVFGNKL